MTPAEKRKHISKASGAIIRELETPHEVYYNLTTATGILVGMAVTDLISEKDFTRIINILSTMSDDILFENHTLYKAKTRTIATILKEVARGVE